MAACTCDLLFILRWWRSASCWHVGSLMQVSMIVYLSLSSLSCARGLLPQHVVNLSVQGLDLDAEAILFQCTGLVATASAADRQAAEIASGLGPGDADPLATSAFMLSSRPTSSKKLWLDFKGGDVTGKWHKKPKQLSLLQ
eukprot:GHUV01040393.1.p2 GENE.GHUV01040393.1~~GHUV01040393.1.p2  ORF type:complete len:141 (-),score=5.90 GHUV01040393.1:622-1044(-)